MSDLKINIGLNRQDFRLALKFNIPRQGITAIVGPSGSGKSSLLRCIAGLEKPQRGYIVSDKHIWFDADKKICRKPQSRRVGMLFQDYALFDHMNVRNNIGYGVPKEERKGLVDYWIQQLSLTTLDDKYPRQLSGGQRQRVALARALAHEPDVLLLDEPFAAADIMLRQKMRQQLKAVVQRLNIPVIIVTHDLEDVNYLADHVGVIVAGELHCFASHVDIQKNPLTRQAAETLGWHNFLMIKSLSTDTVSGSWGELKLDTEIPIESDCLAIRPEHIRLVNSANQGLVAVVKDSVVSNAVRILYCQLQDDSQFVVHRPWDEPVPAIGSDIYLQLPDQHLVALPEHPLPSFVINASTHKKCENIKDNSSSKRASTLPGQ